MRRYRRPSRNPRGTGRRIPVIVGRLVNVCWYFFKLAVGLALLGVALIGVYLYVRMDDEIRRHVEGFLAERYPQLDVRVGGARLVKGRGIAVYDLELSPRDSQRLSDRLVVVDELLLACNVELTTLVQGSPPIHRIEVKHPQVWLRRREDGSWNIDSLLPRQPAGMAVPQIMVRGGEAFFHDTAADDQPLAVRDIAMTMTPTAQPSAPGEWPSLKIDGTASGPQLKELELHAVLAGPQRQFDAAITLKQLQVNAQLLRWIRPALPAALAETKFSGLTDGVVNVSWRGDGISTPTGTATLTLRDGRLEDPRLPRPVTELAGCLTADVQQLKLEELRGKWGESSLAISLNRRGWKAGAPMAVSARIDGVKLNGELYRTLDMFGNPRHGQSIRLAHALREQWDKYSPAGVVDATLQAAFDGQRWSPIATLAGRELSFESDKFAYRLTGGAGTISFRAAAGQQPPLLEINLFGLSGDGQRVNITGQVFDPRSGAAGWAQITGENLGIDERLIAAVDKRIEEACHGTSQSVIASIHPAGKFNLVYWRIERPQPGAELQTSMRLDMTDARINYDGFPYPLQKIRGTIEAVGNRWAFTDFVSGGRRAISAHGSLLPTTPGGPHQLQLHFTGQNVPLDEGLFWAVPEPVREAWKQLQPNGAVNLTTDVRHLLGQGTAPSVSVVLQPQAGATLKPQFFPYFMEDVRGTVSYFDGTVTIDGLTARHQDGVSLGTKGHGVFAGDRGWEFTLTGLWADGIKVRPALMTALPEKLRRLIDSLRPSGTFSLHGSELAFRQPPSAIAPLETRWDLQLECHHTDLHCGIDVDSIAGSVRLQGRSNQQQSFSAGELDLENVVYLGVQFTNVRGPMWVDESQCRFGKWATEQTGQPERRVTGSVYGGAISGNAWVRFSHLPQYGAEVAVAGADLNRLMVERFGARQSFSGKIDGNVILSGEGSSLARLTGEGNAHIREANIYELPLLVSLLKILRNGVPDSTAFDQCDIQFRIQGPHVALNRIDFLGDVVDLYGYGETGFDQHVKLLFRAELGPREYAFPLVKNIVGQASQQFMRMYVDGTLTNPHVTTEAFPGFNQMIQQIRTDLENPSGPAGRQAVRPNPIGRPAGR